MATTLLAVTAGNRMRNLDQNAPAVTIPVVGMQNTSTSFPAIVSNSESSGVPGGSVMNTISLLSSTKDCAVTAVQTRPVALTPAKVSGQTGLSLTSNPVTAASSQRVLRKAEFVQPSQVGPSGSGTTSCSCHKKSTWTDKLNVALDAYIPKDIMPLPDARQGLKKMSSLSALLKEQMKEQMVMSSEDAPENSKASGKKPAKDVDIKALSLNIVDNALSTFHSVGKALVEVMGHDFKALRDAIDELLLALDRHIQAAKSGLGLAKAQTKSEFAYRNERAKANAKKIRSAGERLVKAAGDSIRLGTEEAFKAYERVRGNVKKMREDAGTSRRVRRARRKEWLRKDVQEMKEKMEEEGKLASVLSPSVSTAKQSFKKRWRKDRLIGWCRGAASSSAR